MKSKSAKSKVIVTICVSFCILFLLYITINLQIDESSSRLAETILPKDEFAFHLVPQGGQVGGINGVFIQQASWGADFIDEIDCKHYQVFRFYSDGIVLHQGLCLENDFLDSWSSIKNWFHRDTYEDISRGEYYISGEKIWFSTTSYYSFDDSSITVDYSGTISERNLMLDSYSHFNGYEDKNARYIKINVEE